WIDEHVYARENGMAIGALVALAAADGEAGARHLARARRAAERILGTHVEADGRIWHDGERRSGPLYLGDGASFGLGLARLAQATGDEKLRERAEAIATAMERELLDAETGAYWAQTADANAVGVFARRRQPLEENLAAARFLAALGKPAWKAK